MAKNRPWLERVLWLGGSPCSGKTSIAQALGARYSAALYHCDDHWQAHCHQATPETQPHLWRASRMSWDALWGRDAPALLADELAIYTEELTMIRHDISRLAQTQRLILAEGAALLPNGIASLISDVRQAIWLTPTEAFQRRMYPKRGPWVQEILAQCTEPELAFARWMDRDVAFAQHVAARAKALGLRVLWVDGSSSLAQNMRIVEDWFAPYLPPANPPE